MRSRRARRQGREQDGCASSPGGREFIATKGTTSTGPANERESTELPKLVDEKGLYAFPNTSTVSVDLVVQPSTAQAPFGRAYLHRAAGGMQEMVLRHGRSGPSLPRPTTWRGEVSGAGRLRPCGCPSPLSLRGRASSERSFHRMERVQGVVIREEPPPTSQRATGAHRRGAADASCSSFMRSTRPRAGSTASGSPPGTSRDSRGADGQPGAILPSARCRISRSRRVVLETNSAGVAAHHDRARGPRRQRVMRSAPQPPPRLMAILDWGDVETLGWQMWGDGRSG